MSATERCSVTVYWGKHGKQLIIYLILSRSKVVAHMKKIQDVCGIPCEHLHTHTLPMQFVIRQSEAHFSSKNSLREPILHGVILQFDMLISIW